MLDFIDPSLAVFVFLALLVVFILFKTVLIVPNQQAVVIERLGKFHAVLFAGFHILIPFPPSFHGRGRNVFRHYIISFGPCQ